MLGNFVVLAARAPAILSLSRGRREGHYRRSFVSDHKSFGGLWPIQELMFCARIYRKPSRDSTSLRALAFDTRRGGGSGEGDEKTRWMDNGRPDRTESPAPAPPLPRSCVPLLVLPRWCLVLGGSSACSCV